MAEKRFANLVVIVPGQFGDSHPANKYKPEFCQVVRVLGQSGQFPEEWVCSLGVTLRTLYNWADAHEEFDQALHEAHWLCRAYWARKARESMQGVGMAPSTLSLILQRRFPDMWGKNAKNMHAHFEDRNLDLTAAGIKDGGDGKTGKTKAELLDLIKVYEARRQHTGGGGE